MNKKPTAAEIVKRWAELEEVIPFVDDGKQSTKDKFMDLILDSKAWKPEDECLPKLEVKPENMQEGKLYLLEFMDGGYELVEIGSHLDILDKDEQVMWVTGGHGPGTFYGFRHPAAKALYGPIHLQGEEE